jgi:hypothetical protein
LTQRTEEPNHCEAITPGLDKDINEDAILINRSPEMMPPSPASPSPQASGEL